MRVTFLGNAAWSVPSLEALARSAHEVGLVVTRVPRPAGRGNRPTPTPVAEAARRLGLPLLEVETVRSGEGLQAVRESAPAVLAVVAYGEILPPEVLAIPSVAPVNVHFSMLPGLRGAAPVQHAILQGLPVTGVTTMRMDRGMDTGPVLLQREEPVLPEDDAGSLGRRLALIGGELLVRTLDGLEAGTVRELPQDHARATYAPKLTPADRVVDWTAPAEAVVRRVRALAPEPGAATGFRGRRLRVLRAQVAAPGAPVPGTPPALPGTVVGGRDLVVAAGRGAVRLEVVQPEGRRQMSGEEFVRGYRPEPGEVLGG